jgi:hypothetical protein
MSTAKQSIDLGVRKLSLIEWLAKVQDEALIGKIEELQRKARVKRYESALKPMSAKQLIERAEMANKDINEGRYITSEQLEKESENW